MSKTALDARRAPMYHDEMTASAAPTTGSPKDVTSSPSPTRGSSTTSRRPQDWEAGCAALEAGIQAWPPAAARWPRARRRCSPRSRIATPSASWPIASTTSPPSHYDQDQRDNAANGAPPAACSSCWRSGGQATSWFNPELLALPLETVQRLDAAPTRARPVPLRDRGPVPAAGARARRGRASGCCRSRPQFGARRRRQLRGALDRRRAVPDDHAVDRREGAGDLRALSRHARDQPRPGRSRQGLRRASRAVRRPPEHLRRALQRRAAARLVPCAGARLRDDARRGARRQRHPDVASSRT